MCFKHQGYIPLPYLRILFNSFLASVSTEAPDSHHGHLLQELYCESRHVAMMAFADRIPLILLSTEIDKFEKQDSKMQ